jgi:uncharacterized DUF497 family protein
MYIQNQQIVIQWDAIKNDWLKKERGISFEEIEAVIRNGKILNNINHPNQNKYPSQKQIHVQINNYIYVIPYIYNKFTNTIFLKTIFASRKLTKIYRQQGTLWPS